MPIISGSDPFEIGCKKQSKEPLGVTSIVGNNFARKSSTEPLEATKIDSRTTRNSLNVRQALNHS